MRQVLRPPADHTRRQSGQTSETSPLAVAPLASHSGEMVLYTRDNRFDPSRLTPHFTATKARLTRKTGDSTFEARKT